jgi:hypothetical protein
MSTYDVQMWEKNNFGEYILVSKKHVPRIWDLADISIVMGWMLVQGAIPQIFYLHGDVILNTCIKIDIGKHYVATIGPGRVYKTYAQTLKNRSSIDLTTFDTHNLIFVRII